MSDQLLAQIDLSANPQDVERLYRAYHESRPGENTATEAINLGYQWFQGPVPVAAVTLFTLNAEQYPDTLPSPFLPSGLHVSLIRHGGPPKTAWKAPGSFT